MKRIIHLSDIHFGRFDPIRTKPLIKALNTIKPDFVVISGDFTQRARVKEFKDAKHFMNQIHYPKFVVPGNHDISPLYKPLSRAFRPFKRYQEYISEDLEPVYQNKEIALIGINSVWPQSIKDGRIKKKQIDAITKKLEKIPEKVVKIIVSHHPLDLPKDHPKTKVVRRASVAMNELAKAGVDLFLSGHYHIQLVGDTTHKYNIQGYSALTVQAGTVSDRNRGRPISFNTITINFPLITIDVSIWDDKKVTFLTNYSEHFTYSKGTGWKKSNNNI